MHVYIILKYIPESTPVLPSLNALLSLQWFSIKRHNHLFYVSADLMLTNSWNRKATKAYRFRYQRITEFDDTIPDLWPTICAVRGNTYTLLEINLCYYLLLIIDSRPIVIDSKSFFILSLMIVLQFDYYTIKAKQIITYDLF
jgi:hypothetical protein